MNFKNINWLEADQQAYINTQTLYNNNRRFFEELYGYNSKEQDLILYQIYKIFSYLEDKGSSYNNITINNHSLIIFKEKSFNNPGNIKINLYRNFLQIESSLTKYTENRNFIRITMNKDEIYVNGYLKIENQPTITFKGFKKDNNHFNLEINMPNTQYLIRNDEPWHIFSILIDNILNDYYFNSINNLPNQEIYSKLLNTLFRFGLSKYQEELNRLISPILLSIVDINYYQNEISNFFISKKLQEYLKSLLYEDDITISKNPIKGINVNPDGIEKFLEFEVIDEFNIPHKLVDIPLYLIDDLTKSECPFLDALNSLSIKDIDIYIVGLAYFATYCQDFGELSGNNYYGANIYPRYAGQKMNIAINSSVLNIPLSHYALARYQKNGDNFPQMCNFFHILGFSFGKYERNNQIMETTSDEINTYSFKKLTQKPNPKFSL